MKYLLLILLCSCASTEKLLLTKEKYIVRDIEAKRFGNKQLPRPKEWMAWSVGLFVFTGIIIYTKDGLNKQP